MNERILIDTSVWIEYFKNNDEFVNLIENAFESMSVCITGPVICELLQGVKSTKEYQMLSSCIDAIPFIDVNKNDWVKAGEISHSLKKQGITIPMADIIIGAVCLNNGFKILTQDKHFQNIPGIKFVTQ